MAPWANYNSVILLQLYTNKYLYLKQAECVATQNAPAPASVTIISCKYENRRRLQLTTEFAKTQTTTKRKK